MKELPCPLRLRTLLLLCILAAVAVLVLWLFLPSPLPRGISRQDVHTAVAQATLDKNQVGYLSGECAGEGHRLMGWKTSGDTLTVYAWTAYSQYGFQDGNLVSVSGMGVTPGVFTFSASGGALTCTQVDYPQDGSAYGPSLRKLFPPRYRLRVLQVPSGRLTQTLNTQERAYAAAYLQTIGRQAAIGDYGDFPHPLLTDRGVSVEVSNKVISMPEAAAYPLWLGNQERVEDGVRCVYETSYSPELEEIQLTKYVYDTHAVVTKLRMNAQTGDIIP